MKVCGIDIRTHMETPYVAVMAVQDVISFLKLNFSPTGWSSAITGPVIWVRYVLEDITVRVTGPVPWREIVSPGVYYLYLCMIISLNTRLSRKGVAV